MASGLWSVYGTLSSQRRAGAADAADASDAARARAHARAGAVPRPQTVGLCGPAQEEGVVTVSAVGEEGIVADTTPLGGLTTPETRA